MTPLFAPRPRPHRGPSPSVTLAGALCSITLALLAAPASAQTICHYGSPGTTVSIAPHETAAAEITVHNRLAMRRNSFCDLALDDVQVTIEYDPGPGPEPDWFHVEVSPGFVAVPGSALIDDEAFGTILIFRADSMVIG